MLNGEERERKAQSPMGSSGEEAKGGERAERESRKSWLSKANRKLLLLAATTISKINNDMADDQAVNQSASPVTSSSTPQEGSGQATTRTTGNGIPIPEGISKSAFKRQLKKEEREAGKEARKDFIREKRAAQKERQKDKKKQERQLREQTGGERPAKVQPFKARVVIDCGFDELMSDKVSRE